MVTCEAVDEDLALVPGGGVMTSLTVRAEQAMLGAVLADPAGQQHVLDLVEPADLLRPWHARVLAAMRRVQKNGRPPGPAEMYSELRHDPDLPGSVSADAVPLADLMEASPRTGHASAYAAIVVASDIRRRLDLTGSRLTQAAECGDSDAALQQEVEACRAWWRVLPERLREVLSPISPNDRATALMIRHPPTGRMGIDRRSQGLLAGSGPPVEERGGPIDRHLADTSSNGVGFERRRADGHGQELARPQRGAMEAAGARALRDLAASPSQIAKVRSWLQPENFARPGDGELYALMCDIDVAGMAVDPVTIGWQSGATGVVPGGGPPWSGKSAFVVASTREAHRYGLLAVAAQAGRDIEAGAADQGQSLHWLFQSASDWLPALGRRSECGRRSGKLRYRP